MERRTLARRLLPHPHHPAHLADLVHAGIYVYWGWVGWQDLARGGFLSGFTLTLGIVMLPPGSVLFMVLRTWPVALALSRDLDAREEFAVSPLGPELHLRLRFLPHILPSLAVPLLGIVVYCLIQVFGRLLEAPGGIVLASLLQLLLVMAGGTSLLESFRRHALGERRIGELARPWLWAPIAAGMLYSLAAWNGKFAAVMVLGYSSLVIVQAARLDGTARGLVNAYGHLLESR